MPHPPGLGGVRGGRCRRVRHSLGVALRGASAAARGIVGGRVDSSFAEYTRGAPIQRPTRSRSRAKQLVIQQPPPELSHLLGHEDWLRGLARGLVADGSTADDLVQETWLAALRNPPDPERPARPWLAGVMRNLVKLRRRSEARRQKRQQRAARHEVTPAVTERIERDEIGERLGELVLRLSEPYRSTVLLHYFHGLSAVEIARQEGVSDGTVRWRIWRALDEMRERLRDSGDERRNWLPALLAFARPEKGPPEGPPVALAPVGIGVAFVWKLAAVLLLALLATGWAVDRAARSGERRAGTLAGPSSAEVALRSEAPRDAHSASSTPARRDALGVPAVSTSPASGLRIFEFDGRPAANWGVAVATGDGAFTTLATDAEGFLPESAISPGAHLFLARPAAPLAHVAIRRDEPQHEVHLERGRIVSGRVRVGGRAPQEPLTLFLTIDQPIHEELLLELGIEPVDLFRELSQGRRVRAVTDLDGRFEMHGLADDWSGLLVAPLGHELVGESSGAADDSSQGPSRRGYFTDSLHYPAPVTGLVVDLERLPRVRGRVVDARDGRAIAGAFLNWVPLVDGRALRAVDWAAEEDGRFEIGLPLENATAIRLEYGDEAGERRSSISFTADELTNDLELGELVVGGPRRVRFRVRDAEGQPLAGVRVFAHEDPEDVEPTGADGRGERVLVEEREVTLHARARGFLEGRIELAAFADEPLEIVLERANSVRVLVLDAEGSPCTDLVLSVSSDEPLFLDGMTPAERDAGRAPRRGEQKVLAGGRSGATHLLVRPDVEGTVFLEGLRDAQPIRLELRDATGVAVLSQESFVLNRAERLAFELRAQRAFHSLEGVVEIAGGEGPLVGATVRALDARGGEAKVRTDRDGSFAIRAISSERLRVEVGKAGFVPVVFDEQPVAGGGPLRVVLERSEAR